MIYPTKYQPIRFFDDAQEQECCRDSFWNLQYFNTDPINFQFYVGPCPKENQIVQNPTFNDGGSSSQANWSEVGVVTYNSGGLSGASLINDAQISQSIPSFTGSSNYLLRISITTASIGSILPTSEIRIIGANIPIEFVPQTNVYEFFVKGSGVNGLTIQQVQLQSGATDLTTIQSVQLFEISEPTVSFEDLDGNTLSQIVASEYNAPYFTASFQPSAATIEAGCFNIKVSRTCGSDTTEYLSENISLIPSNICDVLIGSCGQTNYNSDDFQPLLRCRANLRADKSPEFTINRTESASGLQRISYGKMNKAFTLYFDRVPEHIRDFIYTLAIHNEVAIKVGNKPQEKFVVYEEPDEPEFATGDDELALMNLQLLKKEELTETIYKGECAVSLPPKALGSRDQNIAIKAGTDTAIEAE